MAGSSMKRYKWIDEETLRAAIKGKAKVEESPFFAEDCNYFLKVEIHRAEDFSIRDSKFALEMCAYPINLYYVTLAVNHSHSAQTTKKAGMPNPEWEGETFEFPIEEPLDTASLKLELIKQSFLVENPGTSTCHNVVGRVEIPLSKVKINRRDKRIELVKVEGPGTCCMKGVLHISLELVRDYNPSKRLKLSLHE